MRESARSRDGVEGHVLDEGVNGGASRTVGQAEGAGNARALLNTELGKQDVGALVEARSDDGVEPRHVRLVRHARGEQRGREAGAELRRIRASIAGLKADRDVGVPSQRGRHAEQS